MAIISCAQCIVRGSRVGGVIYLSGYAARNELIRLDERNLFRDAVLHLGVA